MNKYPKRKSTRLKEYDYTQPGYYYITVCTNDRKCLFGNILDNNMQLNNAGEMIDQILRTLPEHYSDISIENHIVMPNHIHAIIVIKEPVGAAPRGRPLINTGLSLSDIIYCFKSLTIKRYIDGVKNNDWKPFDKHLWQRSFYDHIIQTDTSLQNIRRYIVNNPETWDNDNHNPDKKDHNKTIEVNENREVFITSS